MVYLRHNRKIVSYITYLKLKISNLIDMEIMENYVNTSMAHELRMRQSFDKCNETSHKLQGGKRRRSF